MSERERDREENKRALEGLRARNKWKGHEGRMEVTEKESETQ